MRTLIAALFALTTLLSLPALATPCSELPVLFIVQDKSGSMTSYAPDGTSPTATNPSKWAIAKSVVPNLADSFSNRFRFGAEMFPGVAQTWSCADGVIAAQVSTSSTGVDNAYANAVVGAGATPTARALAIARTNLLGLSLNTPAYVLLITDGAPNCNGSLDAATCASSNNCAPSGDHHCGEGAIDCIDDAASASAAAALLSSGIKTFVVGFGSDTLGNNLTVLNKIAAAGGTTSAYSAQNQTQLTQVLNTIALNTTTCCNDACTSGTQCAANGQLQTCTYDPTTKCKGWVNSSCPTKSVCTSGSCQSCTDACTLGALQCDLFGDVQQCVPGTLGCAVWSTSQVCKSGELCSAGQCNSCQACTAGATRCSGTGIETCQSTGGGCTAWVAKPCASGSTCSNGACKSCNSTCTAGAKQCGGTDGKLPQTCVADASGCTSWSSGSPCSDFCSGGSCGTCGTSCTPGATQCSGTGVQTCYVDAHGCDTWSTAQQCAPNHYCDTGGLCAECGTSCTQGSMRCAANGATEQCQLDTHGCTTWMAAGQCGTTAADHCKDGMCCHDACTLGANQCSVTGLPETCIAGVSGCTEWKIEPACGAAQTCIDGFCRGACSDDEFQTCPNGTVCTGTVDGGFCLPGDAGVYTIPGTGGGTSGAGGGSATGGGNASGTDAGVDGRTIGASATGCGCSSFEGGLLPLLGLAVLALRRRRDA